MCFHYLKLIMTDWNGLPLGNLELYVPRVNVWIYIYWNQLLSPELEKEVRGSVVECSPRDR